MASRKDSKGRRLRDGESERIKEGRYSYRYTDSKTGKRITVYAQDLVELREKEKEIEKALENDMRTEASIKKITLNDLFDRYIETREIAQSTRMNYISTWNNRVRKEIGTYRAVQIRPSDVKSFYAKLSKAGYSHSTIKLIHDMLFPSLELALDDGMIYKNPSKGVLGDYGREAAEKIPLTVSQEEKLLMFVKSHNVYNVYYQLLIVMLGTGVRCGELIGLTWDDIDMKAKTVNINHQLIYKNYGDGYKLHISKPKTDSGIRIIPMTQAVYKAFEEQREINFMLGKDRDVEIEGCKGFIFTAKSGRPLMPNGINSALYNIVDAYNKAELTAAKKEHRKAELFPKISAHTMRHTACTRMAEKGMDVKVLQHIMGHANIQITMEVYNHITDMARVVREIEKMDSMAANL